MKKFVPACRGRYAVVCSGRNDLDCAVVEWNDVWMGREQSFIFCDAVFVVTGRQRSNPLLFNVSLLDVGLIMVFCVPCNLCVCVQ